MTYFILTVYYVLHISFKLCHGESSATYTDKWAVHIEGGPTVAKYIAEKHGFVYLNEIMPDYYHLQHRRVAKRSVLPSPHHHRSLITEPQVKWQEQQVVKKRVKRDGQLRRFDDPMWSRMWYLNRGHGRDMNVKPAWQKGYTGKGTVVTILDDGIEKNHPDLKKNYDALASYDINDGDADPQPRYDYSNENRHGTRCAGEVAAEANNDICSVGVAYDAGIGGVRMLDGDVSDAVEARSLSLQPQHIDIYSASWGPDDDGRTVDGPASLARKAFYDGITKGRNGLGSIFVWASGNGGRDADNCNCDGYTNSMYTLSISSATEGGEVPWYSEACSSTLAATYSSGSGGEKQVITTDLRKRCTDTHTGTSASAPLAAGICALVLQANKRLTWRDMQHIVVQTARPADLKGVWATNGVKRKVSHSFGYGLMDAAAMAELAANWTTVPKQRRCEIVYKGNRSGLRIAGRASISLNSDGCRGSNSVRYLEHVQAIISLSAPRRGDVQIYLVSPAGTRSTLLARRPRDSSADGFSHWAFMTTHCWGEQPVGTWTLEVVNSAASIFTLTSWSLVFYGTATDPLKARPRSPGGDNSNSIDDEHVATATACGSDEKYINGACVAHCPVGYYSTNMTVTAGMPPDNDTSNTSTSTSQTWLTMCVSCYHVCWQCSLPTADDCHGYLSGRSLVIVLVIGAMAVVVLVAVAVTAAVSICRRRKRGDLRDKVWYSKLTASELLLAESESDDDDEFEVTTSSTQNHVAKAHG